MLDKSKMTKLDELANNSIVTYKNLDDYVKSNNLDKNDFLEWIKSGHSGDGFIEIINCYYLAGDATHGLYMPIKSVHDVTELLLTEIQENDFYDIVECLNDDAKQDGRPIIDMNNIYEVLEIYLEYVQEIAVFKNTSGKYKGDYTVVINEN